MKIIIEGTQEEVMAVLDKLGERNYLYKYIDPINPINPTPITTPKIDPWTPVRITTTGTDYMKEVNNK